MRLTSLLPFRVLTFMGKHFDDEGAWMIDDAKCFWLDAHYWKYARIDMRNHYYPAWRKKCCGECPDDGHHLFICPRSRESWVD